MQTECFTYPSARTGMQISARLYLPDHPPRALVQLVHGMCEYVARYESTIAFLCANGFAVCGNDHLGHGDTARLNHDQRGWFGGWDSSKALVRDVHQLTLLMAERFPALPRLMVCHSMGSFIGRLCIGLYPSDYAGAAVLGTAGIQSSAGLGKSMAVLLGSMHDDRYVSALLNKMVTRNNMSGLTRALTPFDWISRDREVVEAYAADPDCNFVFSLSAFKDLFSLMQECNSPAWFRRIPKTFPMLLASGDHDPVGSFGKGVRQVYNRLGEQGCANVELLLYTDARHELHNELCREEFRHDLLCWMERTLQKLPVSIAEEESL